MNIKELEMKLFSVYEWLLVQLIWTIIMSCQGSTYPRGRNISSRDKNQSAHEPRLLHGSWSDIPDKIEGNASYVDTFIFPEDNETEEKNAGPAFTPKFPKKAVPECAKGSTFCEEVENYPGQYLENILQSAAKNFSDMFGNDTDPANKVKIQVPVFINGN